ncbi:hypothetical protein D9758_013072 [Tetrapyrgos nigripes]|uniref:Uncharacterized protein n=1 Tax=Tetrapyrgos nigripes TaxID=182062 RepID=A0A8H5FQB4_9AGAR|nr:hypothetical protein D9758_013072 [Tetrapyrgos nigripes]
MTTPAVTTVLPYSPIGSPSVDALGTKCHAIYTGLFSGTGLGTDVLQLLSPDFHIIQSPTLPYNASVYTGPLGALQVGDQENKFITPNNLTIRVFTLGESHCIAYGVDHNATLVNNTLGTFTFEFLEHSYWTDNLMQSVKFYLYNTYPIMRGQMLDRGAHRYVEWKDYDDKQREAAINNFNQEFPLNYDPRTV